MTTQWRFYDHRLVLLRSETSTGGPFVVKAAAIAIPD